MTTPTTPRYSSGDIRKMKTSGHAPFGCELCEAVIEQAARDAETLTRAIREVDITIASTPPSQRAALMPTLTRLRDLLAEGRG